jgi:hypothetical protein
VVGKLQVTIDMEADFTGSRLQAPGSSRTRDV